MSKRHLTALSALKRLEQMKLDQLQQEIAGLQQKKEEILVDWRRLEDEKKHETSLDLPLVYTVNRTDYLNRIEADQNHLKASAACLEEDIQSLFNRLSEVFFSKKKIETVTDKLILNQKKEQQRKEQEATDELAIMRHNQDHFKKIGVLK